MPTSQIQAAVDAISAKQIDNEMGTARYSLLFKPGTYGTAAAPLKFQVGYYTEVAGLGKNPTDVTINGSVDVYNRCITVDKCFALNSFWRSLSNLTVNVSGGTTDCRKTGMFWAASQASPMRRVNINGNLTLMDYCTNGPQWASGGFIADSKTDTVTNGSQQQYLVRNSSIGTWSNGVWNQVFAGVKGAPATNFSLPHTNPDGKVVPGHLHHVADQSGEPGEALPLHRRVGQLQRLRAQRRHQFVRHHLGERPDARQVAAAVQLLSWPRRPTRSRPSTASSAAART